MMRSLFSVLVLALLSGCGSDSGGGGSSGGTGGTAASGGTGGTGGSGGSGGTGGSSVVPAGSRVLALEAYHDGLLDHATIVDQAMAVGVKGIPPTLAWGTLEPQAPVAGTPQYAMDWIVAMNLVYAPRDLEVMLSIPTVDTVSLILPPDLGPDVESGAKKLSDPVVIDRMKAMLDALYATADASLKLPYVLVGNEVDIYLGNKPQSFWDEYQVFIEAARTHIKSKRPDTLVGVNIAFQGIVDPLLAPRAKALVSNMDAVFASYYLNGNDFGGPGSMDVEKDVASMVAFAGAKPLILKEFGYATGQSGNSESGQVDFVNATFTAWDQHANAIPYVVYSRMYDGDLAKCTQQAEHYGFGGDADFIQFLCTLGLRRFDDTPKPAWGSFVEAAAARGF